MDTTDGGVWEESRERHRMKDEQKERRRVVVTGIGAVSPNGIGWDCFVSALKAGKKAIRPISLFSPEGLPSRIAGEVVDFDPVVYIQKKDVMKMGRGAQLGIAAAMLALEHRGVPFDEEEKASCPVIIGTSVGGLDFAEKEFRHFFDHGVSKVSPYSGIAVFCGLVSGEISRRLGLHGRSVSISNGCTSSTDALEQAYASILSGDSDIAISGGADCCVSPGIIAAFSRMGVISTGYNDRPSEGSRPFDRDRDGFVIAEGSWVFVLEEYAKAKARNAEIYAELKGFGVTCDAYHPTTPDPAGTYICLSLQKAIKAAGLLPDDIDYFAAYGNGTRINDVYETKVIKEVFGRHAYSLPVSSIKSMIGHSIGSSGAAQVATAIAAITHGFLPPTVGLENPDDACDLDYVPHKSRPAILRHALCNTLSFGGKNAAVVISKLQDDD